MLAQTGRGRQAWSCCAHGREVRDKLSGAVAVDLEHDNGVVIGTRAVLIVDMSQNTAGVAMPAAAVFSGLFGLVT